MTETKTIIGEITGKVNTGKTGTNQKGPWELWKFTVNGDTHSCFDKGIIDNFNIGNKVKIELVQKGTFWNMKNMKLATDEDIGKAEVVKPGENQEDKKARRILKCCAVERAIEMCAFNSPPMSNDTNQNWLAVKKISEEIFTYLNS